MIENSKAMLYTQISIENKKDETQKLREYIVMESEKIMEAKKTFEEDCKRFEKYMQEMIKLAERADLETENAKSKS